MSERFKKHSPQIEFYKNHGIVSENVKRLEDSKTNTKKHQEFIKNATIPEDFERKFFQKSRNEGKKMLRTQNNLTHTGTSQNSSSLRNASPTQQNTTTHLFLPSSSTTTTVKAKFKHNVFPQVFFLCEIPGRQRFPEVKDTRIQEYS